MFAHGRVLWRHPGSEGARFSPALAWSVVAHATRDRPGVTLWDPFCGTGLIPGLARLFFAHALGGVLASDLSAQCVATTRRNLALVSEPDVAEARLAQLRGLRGQNPKSDRRWGEVEAYLQALLPRIEAVPDIPTQVFEGPAHQLPEQDAHLAIVGDTPYGASSTLLGPPLVDVMRSWLDDERVVHVELIVTAEQAAALRAIPALTTRPIRGGRQAAQWGSGR